MSGEEIKPDGDDLVFDENFSEKKPATDVKQENKLNGPLVSVRISASKDENKQEKSEPAAATTDKSAGHLEGGESTEEIVSLPLETPPGTFRRPLSSLLISESTGTFVLEQTSSKQRSPSASQALPTAVKSHSRTESTLVKEAPQAVAVHSGEGIERPAGSVPPTQEVLAQYGAVTNEVLQVASSLARSSNAQAVESDAIKSQGYGFNPRTEANAFAQGKVTPPSPVGPEKNKASELFETLLASAIKGGASDILLKQGQVPMFRWNGELFASRNGPRLEARFFEQLVSRLLNNNHFEKLNNLNDVDISFQSQQAGRVRVNVFRQRGEIALVARLIPMEIPTFEKLEMGQSIRQLIEYKRGLVLVTGATGSGKSTTLAAMLDFINSTRTSHIITIEDPIEFIHKDKKSMFSQRELGLDTKSYADALKSALRQAPDVILVGELRDAATTEVALQAAETGHLVLSTLHTNDAADSLLRIIGMMGHDKEAMVRAQLADSLRGIVSQRLLKRMDRPGRVAAQEIMINTATIREKLVKGGHPALVRDVIRQGAHSGMQSFDQHLLQLVKAGIVEYEEALFNASNREDFALLFNGVNDGRHAS